MEHDEDGVAKWPIDLEEAVGRNVRRLRESRGLSQQRLGTDLLSLGVGMHQTTVAKLEAGSKPLRLNEVAAIAAYFEVPIESLWEKTGETINEHEVALKERELKIVKERLEEARAEIIVVEKEQKHLFQSLASVAQREDTARLKQREQEARLHALESQLHGKH